MSCRRGVVPSLLKEVRISSVDNGYVVRTGDVERHVSATHVFESFEAMTGWLRFNMENNGSDQLHEVYPTKIGGTD
jgi:hypothetical protein